MWLETERLILRKFTLEDFESCAALVANSEVMRFSLKGPMQEKAVAHEYFQSRIMNHYAKYGYGLYAAIFKENKKLIGFVGLLQQKIDGKDQVELGYRLHPDFWGQGLATEAALAVSKYAFEQLGIDQLISIIDPSNARSLKVARRLDMRYWKDIVFHQIPAQVYVLNKVIIRELKKEDIEKLAHAYTAPWSSYEKTLKLWKKYFEEQQKSIRTACILEHANEYVGYGSLLRVSEYPYFKENKIPEINAIWIDEEWRRQGLGERLIKHLERIAFQEGYKTIGIGFGLYKDYGPAQRLYFKLGYAPDGNGITYKCNSVEPGKSYPLDDDLVFWLTKPLELHKKHFRFKLAEKADRELIHSWLKLPHVTEWYYGQGLENTFTHLDHFLNGATSAHYWVALHQDTPFAFLITSCVDKPYNELAKWCEGSGKTITLDMLMGDMRYLGKGYAIPLIHEFLLSQFSDVEEVLIDPEATNARAIHVYQKAGFQKVGEFIPSHSPHLHIMMRLNLRELRNQACLR